MVVRRSLMYKSVMVSKIQRWAVLARRRQNWTVVVNRLGRVGRREVLVSGMQCSGQYGWGVG